MAVNHVFYIKVVDNEDEEDMASFVAINTSSGGALVVSMLG